jgi:hypothetical protein
MQQALQTWANGTCLALEGVQNFTGTAAFSTPLLLPATNGTGNATIPSSSNATLSARWARSLPHHQGLGPRSDYSTYQV